MKSIVEEASSITKAIEKAWKRAGKPEQFSIKIFEEPTVNIFGFVKKSAKIGLFFSEFVSKEKPVIRPKKPQPIALKQKEQPRKEKYYKDSWTTDMVKTANEWIRQVCNLIGLPNMTFSSNVAGNNLRIRFDSSFTGDLKKERMLFSSFAHLIMQTLRNKAKKPLKNLKVVLTSS